MKIISSKSFKNKLNILVKLEKNDKLIFSLNTWLYFSSSRQKLKFLISGFSCFLFLLITILFFKLTKHSSPI